MCSTESNGIKLDAEPLSTLITKEGQRLATKHSLDAYLSRERWSTRRLVNLTHNGDAGVTLPPAEAVAMGAILTRLGREAQA